MRQNQKIKMIAAAIAAYYDLQPTFYSEKMFTHKYKMAKTALQYLTFYDLGLNITRIVNLTSNSRPYVCMHIFEVNHKLCEESVIDCILTVRDALNWED